MNIEYLRTSFSFSDVECQKISETVIPKATNGIISYKTQGEYIFTNRDTVIYFSLRDADYTTEITDLLQRRYVNVARVTAVNDDLFTLTIIFFPGSKRFGQLQVVISEHVRATLIKKEVLKSDSQNFNVLTDNFCFDNGMDECFVFSTGQLNLDDDEKENELENLPADKTEDNVIIEGVLRIFGSKFDLLIRLENIGEQVRVIAYKVIFQKQNHSMLQQIGLGKLSFADEKSYIAASVRRILKETPNYLTSWDEYAKKEGEFLLAKARSVGVITCAPSINAASVDGNIIMTVKDWTEEDSRFEILSAGDVLEMTEDLPIFLQDDVTWENYKNWLLEQKKLEEENKRAAGTAFVPKRKKLFKVKNLPTAYSKFLVLSPLTGNVHFPNTDIHFVYSVRGDETQISRREEARNRISNGTAAMPNLGLILSGDVDASSYSVSSNSSNKHIEPLSAIVREKVFKNPPTDHQIRAIEMALNTPDIAIIQGPPGTGKTTVITAILERLNEISDKSNMAPGSVLVTSLQHDAVNNVIERIRINSLPTIKFGQRGLETTQTLDEAVQNWCAETATKLEEKHEFLQETAQEQECFRLFSVYNISPDKKRAIEFLSKAKMLAKTDIAKRIDEILNELKEEVGGEKNDNLLRLIWRLRSTPEGFADDGQACAKALYYELEEIFGENPREWQKKVLATLQQIITKEISADMLCDIANLRRDLLNRYKPKLKLDDAEPREDIIAVYQDLRESLRHPQDAKREIIYNLHAELKEGTPEIKKALSAYTFAFAATAQQSDSRDIKFAKGVPNYKELTSHASYDTVIVDEAARVSPGDLMIPLSLASRRVILVGDHKQLPHIYDEEIFEKLLKEGKITSDDDIKISMFQHLWGIAKGMEKHDGIKRTITLDKQYRTHPKLGEFVSENFYKGQDGEGFTSPRRASEFVQSISRHACMWVDIPSEKGAMSRLPNGTRKREVEATYIAQKLTEYLSRDDCKDLTFGVITFYSGQRDLIKGKIGQLGERVRIGTVDEFQGMEFDVIFLSVVRSGGNFNADDLEQLRTENAAQDGTLETITKKYYGFLNDNRLCVALSRQKKLLIVVGDGAMFSGRAATPFAKRCVPAMYNLYALCEEEGSIVDG